MPMIMSNPDGRLEMFMIGEGGLVFHSAQLAVGSGFGSWGELSTPGYQVNQLCVARNSDGHLEAFAINLGGIIVHSYQAQPGSGPWSPWAEFSTPGYQVKLLSVAANQDGRLELFAVNMGDSVVHSFQKAPNQGPWSTWDDTSFGMPEGKPVTQVTATLDSSGRINVGSLANDTNPYRNIQIDQNGLSGWTGWGLDLPGNPNRNRLFSVVTPQAVALDNAPAPNPRTDPDAFKAYVIDLKKACDQALKDVRDAAVAGGLATATSGLPGLVAGTGYVDYKLDQASNTCQEMSDHWEEYDHILDQQKQDSGMVKYIKDNFGNADPHIYRGVDGNGGDVTNIA